MSQKEVVYKSVLGYLQDKGIEYNPDVKVELSKEQRKDVELILVECIDQGVLELKPDAKAWNDIPKYCKGLLDNWLRKDTRLTGGVEWVTKKPGSRAYVGDKKMKALKQLRSLLSAQGQDVSEVDVEIAKRQAELDAEKKPEIDMSQIPDHLKHLIGA